MEYFDYSEDANNNSDSDNITILNDLSEEEWEMIVRSAHSISFKEQEYLLEEGSNDDSLYILVAGKVEVVANPVLADPKKLPR